MAPKAYFDFRQIVVSNCVVTRSTRAFACYALDGGVIEQVRIANVVCDTDIAFIFNHPLHLDARQRKPESKLSTIRDIRVSNFTARTDGRILLTAADGTTIEDVEFDGIGLDYALFCDPAEFAPDSTGHQVSRHSPEAAAPAPPSSAKMYATFVYVIFLSVGQKTLTAPAGALARRALKTAVPAFCVRPIRAMTLPSVSSGPAAVRAAPLNLARSKPRTTGQTASSITTAAT